MCAAMSGIRGRLLKSDNVINKRTTEKVRPMPGARPSKSKVSGQFFVRNFFKNKNPIRDETKYAVRDPAQSKTMAGGDLGCFVGGEYLVQRKRGHSDLFGQADADTD